MISHIVNKAIKINISELKLHYKIITLEIFKINASIKRIKTDMTSFVFDVDYYFIFFIITIKIVSYSNSHLFFIFARWPLKKVHNYIIKKVVYLRKFKSHTGVQFNALNVYRDSKYEVIMII